jgi:hypothetical protein
VGYRRLFNYLIGIGLGSLGLFNSSKLEIRYETNSNLELLCQNGMIVSSVIIIYFSLAFIVEILTMRARRRRKKVFVEKKPLSATEFYEQNVREEE